MTDVPAKPVALRKRNRKRKRRAASSSSSSSSSSSDSDSDNDSPKISKPIPVKKAPIEESSGPSSTDSDSDSESEAEKPSIVPTTSARDQTTVPKQVPSRNSPSPSPPPATIPSFLPPSDAADAASRESALKEKFRKFWMASVADGFKDDLEEIRKEPNLGTSRLALLIDSLASGADVFSSSHGAPDQSNDINEMEVALQ